MKWFKRSLDRFRKEGKIDTYHANDPLNAHVDRGQTHHGHTVSDSSGNVGYHRDQGQKPAIDVKDWKPGSGLTVNVDGKNVPVWSSAAINAANIEKNKNKKK